MSPPTITETSTRVDSSTTPSPTLQPLLGIQSADDQFPEGFIQLSQEFRNLRSGSYVILAEHAISIDGIDAGDISSFTSEVEDFSVGDYHIGWTNDIENAHYFVAKAKVTSVLGRRGELSALTEMLIERLSLWTGVHRVWRATFHPESGSVCIDIHLSPDGRRVAGNCLQDGEASLYMIDLDLGSVNTLRSTHNPCLSTTGRDTRWVDFNWSPDGSWLSVTCPMDYQNQITCLVSSQNGEFHCSQPAAWYDLMAWSPDGDRVAIQIPSIQEYGIYYTLLITDTSCLQNEQACPEYLKKTISDSSDLHRALGGVSWDWSGEKVYWSTFVVDYTTEGFATVWMADLTTGEVNHIDARPGARVRSISPDGMWIVLSNSEGMTLLSRNGQVLRRIPQDDSHNYTVWDYSGWLVIP